MSPVILKLLWWGGFQQQREALSASPKTGGGPSWLHVAKNQALGHSLSAFCFPVACCIFVCVSLSCCTKGDFLLCRLLEWLEKLLWGPFYHSPMKMQKREDLRWVPNKKILGETRLWVTSIIDLASPGVCLCCGPPSNGFAGPQHLCSPLPSPLSS